jgi:uncharacterized protein (TIGR03086 family)
VEGLLFHVFFVMAYYVVLAERGTVSLADFVPPVVKNGAHLSTFQSLAEQGWRAWRQPGVLDRKCDYILFGTVAGSRVLSVHIADLLVHGWDLAKATGQDDLLDEACAEFALRSYDLVISADETQEVLRSAKSFKEPTAVSEGAAIQTRLIALTGRRIDWSPAQV